MNKFLDIMMPVGGGIGGGVVGVMEGSNKIQLLAIQTIEDKFIDMLINILTLLPTMVVGAIVGWIVKKTCDYFLIYEILSKFAKTELSITLNYNIT